MFQIVHLMFQYRTLIKKKTTIQKYKTLNNSDLQILAQKMIFK